LAAGTLDAHVSEGADDRVDRLGVDEVVGQVIVDLGVREKPTVLAELDQRLELVAAGFEVFLGAVVAALERLFQRLFLGAAVLGATLGGQLLHHLHAGVHGAVIGLRHCIDAIAGRFAFGGSRLRLATRLALGSQRLGLDLDCRWRQRRRGGCLGPLEIDLRLRLGGRLGRLGSWRGRLCRLACLARLLCRGCYH